ncbi:MAG: helix-turn-helix domain-containing protein, partial [Pseudonocardiaceae bacterium]
MAAGHGRSLLEAARVARGLTQQALARRSGTTQPTLSAYERGAKSPTLGVLDRILASLDFELGLNDK